MTIRLIIVLAAVLAGVGQPAAQAAAPVSTVVSAASSATGARLALQDRARDRRSNDRRQDRRTDRADDRRDDQRNDRWDNRRDRREDRLDDRRDERWERYWRYRIGLRLLTLPARHSRVVIGSTVYYYADGVYLVSRGGGFVVVRSPIGARIRTLPYGFRSVWIGPRRYFFVNSTYYVYAPATSEYVVVAAPAGGDAAVKTLSPDPIVYPAQGQTEAQVDQDRYECHGFAMDESGFDPTRSQQQGEADRSTYNRALKACLTGRGYTVE